MLKILQARLQEYVNHELPDVQTGFRKGKGARDQIANIHWIIEKAREFQKNIYFCFINYAKAFDCVDHKKLWKILHRGAVTGTDQRVGPCCWELGFQAWAQSTCPELSAQGLVPLSEQSRTCVVSPSVVSSSL